MEVLYHGIKTRYAYDFPLCFPHEKYYISNNENLNTDSYTGFGYTYQPPPGYTYDAANTQALLAGTYYFTPSEVEVFYLK